MKTIWTGFALSCQFFTAIPVKRQLEMNKQTVTAMFSLLPIIGVMIGSLLAVILYSLTTYTSLSTLFIAVVVVVASILLTGGLHMDGWLDMSDAFFSYGNIEKRQQVLDDPRTGAFGVISFVVLFALKVVTIYELVQHVSLLSVILIPFLARVAVLLFFVNSAPAKEKGLGAYFKRETNGRVIASVVVCYLFIAVVVMFISGQWSLFVMIILVLVGVFLYIKWSRKHFGGMSGDLMGALCEGMEVCLWISLLLFI